MCWGGGWSVLSTAFWNQLLGGWKGAGTNGFFKKRGKNSLNREVLLVIQFLFWSV